MRYELEHGAEVPDEPGDRVLWSADRTYIARWDRVGGGDLWHSNHGSDGKLNLLWPELLDRFGPVFDDFDEVRRHRNELSDALVPAVEPAESATTSPDADQSDARIWFTPQQLVEHDERTRRFAAADERDKFVRELADSPVDPTGQQLGDGVQALVAEVVGTWARKTAGSRTATDSDLRTALDQLAGAARVMGWVEL